MNSKPKQYLQGYTEFYKQKFKVTPDVLSPRPETELLVDEVLNFLQTTNLPAGRQGYKLPTILDLGTGCGNIAISIAKNASNVKIMATDISAKALKVARQNAKLHGVLDKITFLHSNLLSSFNLSVVRSHTKIVVTNLPYIPTQRIPYLDPLVKDFEPHIALDGGNDGFKLYRKLFRQISSLQTGFVIESTHRVWQPKLIVCEIDYTQGELSAVEAQKYFPDAQIEVKTDLAHKQRILLVKF